MWRGGLAYEKGYIRVDRGLFADKGNYCYDVTHPDFGAKGDGVTDDSLAIQMAIDFCYAAGGGYVYVPAGTFMVDVSAALSTGMTAQHGIVLKTNVKLIGAGKGVSVIKAIPTSSDTYMLCRVGRGANNLPTDSRETKKVGICDITLQGERDDHIGSTGQAGMVLNLANCEDVWVRDAELTGGWGDGCNLDMNDLTGSDGDATTRPLRVLFDNVDSHHNRRNGYSVTAVDGLLIQGGSARDQSGQSPEAGIDIEPDFAPITCENIKIIGVDLRDNGGAGLEIVDTSDGSIGSVLAAFCDVTGNGGSENAGLGYGVKIVNNDAGKTIRLNGLNCTGNYGDNIHIRGAGGTGTRRIMVTGCEASSAVKKTIGGVERGSGIVTEGTPVRAVLLSGNMCFDNPFWGINMDREDDGHAFMLAATNMCDNNSLDDPGTYENIRVGTVVESFGYANMADADFDGGTLADPGIVS